MATMGERIRDLRKAKNMTLDELAVKIGTKKSYIWGVENGRIQNPSAENLAKIADCLNTTINVLLDNVDNAKEEEKEILYRNYCKLNEDDRQRLDDILELWIKQTKN